jgi:GNAT superfamily N-acetyltransferase
VLGAHPLEIARFYVETQWIGSGIGTALMRACLGEAAALGCDVVWLDVWERNARAIAFCSKWGFSVVGGQDFVLGEDVEHDLLMARSAV